MVNECVQTYNCFGLCCQDGIIVSRNEFNLYFVEFNPQSITQVEAHDSTSQLLGLYPGASIFFAIFEQGYIKLIFSKLCPRNSGSPNFNCDISGKILNCKSFKIDGELCRNVRRNSH